jgi:hypothetical protein
MQSSSTYAETHWIYISDVKLSEITTMDCAMKIETDLVWMPEDICP